MSVLTSVFANWVFLLQSCSLPPLPALCLLLSGVATTRQNLSQLICCCQVLYNICSNFSFYRLGFILQSCSLLPLSDLCLSLSCVVPTHHNLSQNVQCCTTSVLMSVFANWFFYCNPAACCPCLPSVHQFLVLSQLVTTCHN